MKKTLDSTSYTTHNRFMANAKILTRTRDRHVEYTSGPSETGGWGVTRNLTEAATFATVQDAEKALYPGGRWKIVDAVSVEPR